MLEKLLQYYDDVVINDIPKEYKEYEWYTDEENRIIGIEKKQLTIKDKEMLSLFLTSISTDEFFITPAKRMWKELLFQEGKIIPTLQREFQYVRFLHFSMKQPFFEKKTWEEALQGLLSTSFVVLWKDHRHGIIIETYPFEASTESLDHEMIATLTSDFFISLRILAGKRQMIDGSLPSAFVWEEQIFEQALPFMTKQNIYQLEDVLPYVLISNPQLAQPLLTRVKQDTELLRTIRTYLECNMNLTLAAKKQYMHRNSVQYRVDKFIEKTGIDIKTFTGAVTVYIALLLNEMS
ncbi:PucR family transcriptional regulator [Ectobacillus sp. sgz5001026]|uniref:PucR family transcriptional regulator n=1 Tax=Ectobacillus sp. sgz5001026 TaxID=3242473 RepID=UPI0036D4161B